MKNYYIQYNIGKVRYAVNHHDGKDVHKDGSPFYNIATFFSKKKMEQFEKGLQEQGYKYRTP